MPLYPEWPYGVAKLSRYDCALGLRGLLAKEDEDEERELVDGNSLARFGKYGRAKKSFFSEVFTFRRRRKKKRPIPKPIIARIPTTIPAIAPPLKLR